MAIPVLKFLKHKMSLLNTFRLTLPLLLVIPSEVTPKARTYEVQNERVIYQEAWEACKQKGLQLATADTYDEYNELASILNRTEYTGEYFWAAGDIDRNVGWKYITFNDGELTLISEDGQKATTRCMLVKDSRYSGTSWSYDLCTQEHRYICDKI